MQFSLPSFLLPPQSTNYERTQRARLLHVMSISALLAGFFFAIQNIIFNDIPSAISLFMLAGISLIALYLNHVQHFRVAAFVFGGAVLGVLDYALFEGGASLNDPGIVVYPIFILCTTFLFGTGGLIFSILLSIGSVALLYLLEANKIFTPLYPSMPSRVLGLSTLFVVTALITWAVRESWETHLAHLQQSYDLTLQGWARALEYRDGETEGHSRRVTELCVTLAKKLGVSDEEILNMRRGALLHDIGKMAIPDRILFKPGPLDAEERKIMEQHPTLAVRMISGIPFLQPALSIPIAHHENWDGSGYPAGLKGEGIPQSARIFTIVDHWDALSSDRPYRKAWAKANIILHLQENSGRLYDPRIVDAFLAIVAEKEE